MNAVLLALSESLRAWQRRQIVPPVGNELAAIEWKSVTPHTVGAIQLNLQIADRRQAFWICVDPAIDCQASMGTGKHEAVHVFLLGIIPEAFSQSSFRIVNNWLMCRTADAERRS